MLQLFLGMGPFKFQVGKYTGWGQCIGTAKRGYWKADVKDT